MVKHQQVPNKVVIMVVKEVVEGDSHDLMLGEVANALETRKCFFFLNKNPRQSEHLGLRSLSSKNFVASLIFPVKNFFI